MQYRIGQTAEGKVTGIQPYGAFVMLDRQTSGLIHISEISDGYVRDISRYVKVGDTVTGTAYEKIDKFGMFVAVDDMFQALIPNKALYGNV